MATSWLKRAVRTSDVECEDNMIKGNDSGEVEKAKEVERVDNPMRVVNRVKPKICIVHLNPNFLKKRD